MFWKGQEPVGTGDTWGDTKGTTKGDLRSHRRNTRYVKRWIWRKADVVGDIPGDVAGKVILEKVAPWQKNILRQLQHSCQSRDNLERTAAHWKPMQRREAARNKEHQRGNKTKPKKKKQELAERDLCTVLPISCVTHHLIKGIKRDWVLERTKEGKQSRKQGGETINCSQAWETGRYFHKCAFNCLSLTTAAAKTAKFSQASYFTKKD